MLKAVFCRLEGSLKIETRSLLTPIFSARIPSARQVRANPAVRSNGHRHQGISSGIINSKTLLEILARHAAMGIHRRTVEGKKNTLQIY